MKLIDLLSVPIAYGYCPGGNVGTEAHEFMAEQSISHYVAVRWWANILTQWFQEHRFMLMRTGSRTARQLVYMETELPFYNVTPDILVVSQDIKCGNVHKWHDRTAEFFAIYEIINRHGMSQYKRTLYEALWAQGRLLHVFEIPVASILQQVLKADINEIVLRLSGRHRVLPPLAIGER